MKKFLYILPVFLFVFMAQGVFAAESDDFVITVTTTSPDFDFTIPVAVGPVYNYDVDCEDDGSIGASAQTGEYLCEYSSAGPHTIRIIGTFPRAYFGASADNRDKLTSIKQWGTTSWTSMNSAFEGCSNLVINDALAPNLSGLTDMGNMFQDATSIGGGTGTWVWDTSTVTRMNRMFDGATSFNENITGWNVTNVTSMYAMFEGAILFNQNIGAWTITNLNDAGSMFKNATVFNGNVGLWGANFGSVMYVLEIFENAVAFNQPVDSWDVSGVMSMKDMFYNAEAFNQNLNSWDVNGVTSMESMFGMTDDFNGDITNWNTSGVLTMEGMFEGASSFNQDLGNPLVEWQTVAVTNMDRMFKDATAFNNGEVGNTQANKLGWNTSNVTTMENMFEGATSFNQNLFDDSSTAWNVSNVRNMYSMFQDATIFNGDISNWDVSKVTEFNYMFQDAAAFNQNIGGWDVSSSNTAFGMFQNATSFNQNIGNWDVSGVSNFFHLFDGATAFDQDLSGWDVSNVTNMGSMFSGVKLSTTNYNALLNGWSTQSLQDNVTFDGGTSNYCSAKSARNSMIADYTWVITDGGETSGCPPILSEVTAVTTPTSDSTPNYTFNTDEGGTISYGGSCSSTTTIAIVGNNTITFDELAVGTYSDCTIAITDNELDTSSNLFVTSFTIENKTSIYRLYNTKTGVHLYTKGATDRDKILAKWSNFEYTDSGAAFYASVTDDGNTPIYRLYNTKTGVHLYTKGATDRDKILAKWSNFEYTDSGAAFYLQVN